MQITSLNRVVNLILVGTFVLLLFVCFKFDEIVSYFGSDRFKGITTNVSEAIIAFVIAFLLLSLTMCLGLIVDAFATLIRRRSKNPFESKIAARLLRCANALEDLTYHRENFNKVFNADARYEMIRGTDEQNKSYAAAIFFQTAKPEQVEWTLQHYSMYVLATSYFTVLLLCLPLAWCTNYSFRGKERRYGICLIRTVLTPAFCHR